MGVKSVLKKIGKVALTAAPYIAAPFTGGASLMATGLANKAVQKWSEKDAKKAIAQGKEPSKFDRVLGRVGAISGLASSFIPTNALGAIGMLGKGGSIAGKAIGPSSSVLSKVAGGALGKSGGGIAGAIGGSLGKFGTSAAMNAMSRGGGSPIGPSANFQGTAGPRMENRMPNLAYDLEQGRQEGIASLPEYLRPKPMGTTPLQPQQPEPMGTSPIGPTQPAMRSWLMRRRPQQYAY